MGLLVDSDSGLYASYIIDVQDVDMQ